MALRLIASTIFPTLQPTDAPVVRALPGQDRRCVFLRAEGLRYRDIADILDTPLGALSLSLARVARSAER